jgi:hypothetical protein
MSRLGFTLKSDAIVSFSDMSFVGGQDLVFAALDGINAVASGAGIGRDAINTNGACSVCKVKLCLQLWLIFALGHGRMGSWHWLRNEVVGGGHKAITTS